MKSFFLDLFIATKGRVQFCVITGRWFFEYSMGTEDNEGTLAEGSFLGSVSG